MKGKKFYRIVIGVLVLINIVTIILLTTRPKNGHLPPKGGIGEKLNFSDEKKAIITPIEKNHHTEKRALMNKEKELHEALFSTIGTGQQTDSIMQEINTNHAEIEQITYDFFNEVATHCNEEQLNELHTFIHHAFKRIHPKKKS